MESQLCGGVFVAWLSSSMVRGVSHLPTKVTHQSQSIWWVSLSFPMFSAHFLSISFHRALFLCSLPESLDWVDLSTISLVFDHISPQREPLKCEKILFSTQRVERKEKRVSFHASTKRAEVEYFFHFSSMRVNYTPSWNWARAQKEAADAVAVAAVRLVKRRIARNSIQEISACR